MIYYANDKFSAVLTAGYSVGQSTLYVSAVPDNVPTVIVAAKGTDNETVFEVTDKTTNSLTGVSRLRGADVDLDAQTPLTCLNNEEFINQFERATGAEVDTGTDEAKIVTPKAIADSKVSYTDGVETLTNKTITSPVIRAYNFWVDANETWAYASATTITVPAGATAKYQKGDKIRLKQGGDWKYFYVVGVADTLLTVTGGTDYTVASAAITDNYYSKAENPQGFPDWFNYTPTIDYSGGSVDPTSMAIDYAKFKINGTAVTILIKTTLTLGSGNRTIILYSLPVTVASPSPIALYGFENIVATNRVPRACLVSSGAVIRMDLLSAMANNGGNTSICGTLEF